MPEKNLTSVDLNSVACVGADVAFHHPSEVVTNAAISKERKRAILAAWASDAHSVENAPGLRQIESGAIVSLADILAALRVLDGSDWATHCNGPNKLNRKRRRWPIYGFSRWGGKEDDDDDPPPSPAAAEIPRFYIRVNAQAA